MSAEVAMAIPARQVVAGDRVLALGHPAVTTIRVVYTLFNEDMYGAEGIWLESSEYYTTDEFMAKYPGTYAFPPADIACKADDLVLVFR